jgi:hypothetical protein
VLWDKQFAYFVEGFTSRTVKSEPESPKIVPLTIGYISSINIKIITGQDIESSCYGVRNGTPYSMEGSLKHAVPGIYLMFTF